ncbi:hypothetical protein RhiirA4_546299 [Rhizophagus irregularis]|uniref:Uncharacterized protein n=1 Tax=Rhizophagus irregularis TaxID=588596 RepID=A0A2I1GWI5_9GLOM|nr:hypothetical protein RhiirA4_546299 [Rhizophagus irregularis]
MFDILRNAAKELYLPTFSFSQNPKLNDKLKLDILSYISSHKGGWTFDVISIGKKFIKELSDALWYVDKCGYKTFNDRQKHYEFNAKNIIFLYKSFFEIVVL